MSLLTWTSQQMRKNMNSSEFLVLYKTPEHKVQMTGANFCSNAFIFDFSLPYKTEWLQCNRYNLKDILT